MQIGQSMTVHSLHCLLIGCDKHKKFFPAIWNREKVSVKGMVFLMRHCLHCCINRMCDSKRQCNSDCRVQCMDLDQCITCWKDNFCQLPVFVTWRHLTMSATPALLSPSHVHFTQTKKTMTSWTSQWPGKSQRNGCQSQVSGKHQRKHNAVRLLMSGLSHLWDRQAPMSKLVLCDSGENCTYLGQFLWCPLFFAPCLPKSCVNLCHCLCVFLFLHATPVQKNWNRHKSVLSERTKLPFSLVALSHDSHGKISKSCHRRSWMTGLSEIVFWLEGGATVSPGRSFPPIRSTYPFCNLVSDMSQQ